MAMKREGVKVVQSWRADWNKFIREAFGVHLDREQQAIVSAVQHEKMVAVASGTARGKDFVSACIALSFLYLTPRWNAKGELIHNTKVALTAPTDRQVKNIMMPEVARLYKKARSRGVDLIGKLNAYDIRTGNEEWFLTGFKADDNNREAWSGFHAVNTMFVVTEASGISELVYESIEGNLQGNSRLLIVFNPNHTSGYAYKAMKSDRFKSFHLNSLNAENVTMKRNVIPGQVDYEWVCDKVKAWASPISKDDARAELDDFEFEGRWYRPDDLFRVKVLGQFPMVSEDTLVPPQWVDLAVERWKAREMPYHESIRTHVLGVDVAGMGRDATVFCEKRDDYVCEMRTIHSGGTANHMEVAGMIRAERERYPKRLYVSIDTIGEGAGVYARVVEQEKEMGRIISCKYSEGASGLKDSTGQYHFKNMRAYLFWSVREWLDPKNGHEACLPPDVRLREELTEVRWYFASDGAVQIEPKEDLRKRLGRSTDLLDALANTFYPIRRVPERADLKRLESIAF